MPFPIPILDIDGWNKLFQFPLDQLSDTYSSGMKAKLALDGSIACYRKVLIPDEPFNGRPGKQRGFYQVLNHLRNQGSPSSSFPYHGDLTNTCDAISYPRGVTHLHPFPKKSIRIMQLSRSEIIAGQIGDV